MCTLEQAGDVEPGNQIQQSSPRGGWATPWEACDRKCGQAGC